MHYINTLHFKCFYFFKVHSTELTQISHPACTPNAVDILFNVTWKIKVDDVFHMGNVQSTSSHLYGHNTSNSHHIQHTLVGINDRYKWIWRLFFCK